MNATLPNTRDSLVTVDPLGVEDEDLLVPETPLSLASNTSSMSPTTKDIWLAEMVRYEKELKPSKSNCQSFKHLGCEFGVSMEAGNWKRTRVQRALTFSDANPTLAQFRRNKSCQPSRRKLNSNSAHISLKKMRK